MAETGALRLSGPDDVIAAVPLLLGFHPSDSLVVMALSGPASRAGFVARVDLPTIGDEAGMAAELGRALSRAEATGSLALAYTDRRADAERTLQAMAEVLCAVGAPARDLLHVGSNRWWSLLCRDPGCCPSDGRTYDLSTSRVTAEAVFAGLRTLPARGCVGDRIAAPSGAGLLEAREVSRRLGKELMVAPHRWRAGQTAAAQTGRRLLAELLQRRRADPTAVLTCEEATRLAMLLEVGAVRDVAYLRMTPEWVPIQVDLWSEVLRLIAPPHDGIPAALLSIAVWRNGGGALAVMAAERAAASNPSHPAVRLARDLLAAALPPEVWDERFSRDLARAIEERN